MVGRRERKRGKEEEGKGKGRVREGMGLWSIPQDAQTLWSRKNIMSIGVLNL
jgi:hypothetical protein